MSQAQNFLDFMQVFFGKFSKMIVLGLWIKRKQKLLLPSTINRLLMTLGDDIYIAWRANRTCGHCLDLDYVRI